MRKHYEVDTTSRQYYRWSARHVWEDVEHLWPQVWSKYCWWMRLRRSTMTFRIKSRYGDWSHRDMVDCYRSAPLDLRNLLRFCFDIYYSDQMSWNLCHETVDSLNVSRVLTAINGTEFAPEFRLMNHGVSAHLLVQNPLSIDVSVNVSRQHADMVDGVAGTFSRSMVCWVLWQH
jgi:hypothetical protein